MHRIVVFVLFLSAMFSTMAQTDLYKRYADRTDIRVASVSNFELDSGITADVTLLEAIDDEGWQWLCREFSLVELSSQQMDQIRQGWDVTMFAHRSPADPTKPADNTQDSDQQGTCYLGVSYLSRTIYFFCCTTDKQSDVVVKYLIEKMHHSKR